MFLTKQSIFLVFLCLKVLFKLQFVQILHTKRWFFDWTCVFLKEPHPNEIFAGAGDDIIYSGSGNDLINSGSGDDTLWLGGGDDLIVLQSGNGFDTIKNFQLGLTTFDAGDSDQLSIVDGANGSEISRGGDLLAVVSWTQASTLIDNLDMVFV
ncbi:MAG: hypothetical protein F6K55_01380 [Moorea sp. SIO4A3]|nr:hypothetical protein [Moorena sp. SIO4A3]